MASQLDLYLQQIHRIVFGLGSMQTVSSNTIFYNSTKINSNLNVTGSVILNSVSVLSDLNISSNSILNTLSGNYFNVSGNVSIGALASINSSFQVSGFGIFQNNMNCNNIYITNNTIINNNLTINSNLYSNNDFNNILGNITVASNINISGLASFQSFSINNLTISSSSLLQDNVSATTIVGKNNIINNNLSINSQLYVSNISIFQNNVTMNSLFILGNTILNDSGTNSITAISLLVKGNTNIIGNTNIYNYFDVSGYSLLNLDSISNASTLFVSGSSLFNNGVSNLASLNVSNYAIFNNLTLNSLLNVANNGIFNNISINSSLNITGNTQINNSFIANSLTVLSNLNISGSTNIISNINILNRIIGSLPEYFDNTSAINGGVPLWGFYRTGGIIKIRLNEVPPIMTLLGNSIISLSTGNIYIDPGINALAIDDGYITTYLLSFVLNSNNLIALTINNPIPIIGTSTTIIGTDLLSSGTYILTYQATDSSSNISLITRTVIYS